MPTRRDLFRMAGATAALSTLGWTREPPEDPSFDARWADRLPRVGALKERPYLPTHVEDLDWMARGLPRGLTLLAAPTGAHKSGFVAQLLAHVARLGLSFAVFTPRTSIVRCGLRVIEAAEFDGKGGDDVPFGTPDALLNDTAWSFEEAVGVIRDWRPSKPAGLVVLADLDEWANVSSAAEARRFAERLATLGRRMKLAVLATAPIRIPDEPSKDYEAAGTRLADVRRSPYRPFVDEAELVLTLHHPHWFELAKTFDLEPDEDCDDVEFEPPDDTGPSLYVRDAHLGILRNQSGDTGVVYRRYVFPPGIFVAPGDPRGFSRKF